MDKQKLEAFLGELLALCQKHNAKFDACPCCNGVNLELGGDKWVFLNVTETGASACERPDGFNTVAAGTFPGSVPKVR